MAQAFGIGTWRKSWCEISVDIAGLRAIADQEPEAWHCLYRRCVNGRMRWGFTIGRHMDSRGGAHIVVMTDKVGRGAKA